MWQCFQSFSLPDVKVKQGLSFERGSQSISWFDRANPNRGAGIDQISHLQSDEP